MGTPLSPDGVAAGTIINKKDVINFLRDNPGFLNEHPDVLSELDPPGHERGRGIHDFQEAMIRRLRERLDDSIETAHELIDTSRENMSIQSRVHECVLSLLRAPSFERLIDMLQSDVATLLDMDMVVLALENTGQEPFPVGSVTALAPGSVDRLLGQGQEMVLRSGICGETELFSVAASLIRSDALIRLHISDASPPAILAFGHRDPEKFHPGQATELITFLSSVLEQLIRIWLDLPE